MCAEQCTVGDAGGGSRGGPLDLQLTVPPRRGGGGGGGGGGDGGSGGSIVGIGIGNDGSDATSLLSNVTGAGGSGGGGAGGAGSGKEGDWMVPSPALELTEPHQHSSATVGSAAGTGVSVATFWLNYRGFGSWEYCVWNLEPGMWELEIGN